VLSSGDNAIGMGGPAEGEECVMFLRKVFATGLLAILLPSVTAVADGQDRPAVVPTISCGGPLQASFAAAVPMIGSNPTVARREFQRMLANHPDCAILHWGVAKTAGDAAERRSEWLNAVYYGATRGATREEWGLISSVAPDRE